MTIRQSTLLISLFFLTSYTGVNAQKKGSADKRAALKALSIPRTDTFLKGLLGRHPQYFDTLLPDHAGRKIQVIYTKIDRRKDNQPLFTHYYFNLDTGLYFYPASTIKLPVAVLALQKINDLKIKGLNREATMVTGSAAGGGPGIFNDPSAPDGRPTIEHYIKKILLVSDNEASNRLYEFAGQEYINQTLQQMGYHSAQIIHQLGVQRTDPQNRSSPAVRFFDTSGRQLYRQPALQSSLRYAPRSNRLGLGFYRNDTLVREPFDFSLKNRLGLQDLHTMLQALMFPSSVPRSKRFRLTESDYRFLYRYLSLSPQQSRFPQYDSTYNDTYVKFLFYGGQDPQVPGIHVFNKVGNAYGFLIDAAYFMDVANGIEFMLSATIHCNSDGIYNDDRYEYETVGLPFMRHLGQVIYAYELKRDRKHKPDFRKTLPGRLIKF